MGLGTFVVKRTLQTIATIFVVLSLVFFIVRAIPGDPARVLVPNGDPETIEAIREELGLNMPVHEAYIDWVIGFVQGDLGNSIFFEASVTEILFPALGPAISIGTLGFLFALLIGIPGGIISAVNQYKWQDNLVTIISFFGISMPAFWVGILLILTLGTPISFLPSFGYVSPGESIVGWFLHILLPAMSIGIPYGGIILRFMRSSLLDVFDKQYMQTAHSKGLSPRIVLYKHGIQNALIPVVTQSGIVFAIALAGVVAVEIVFGINAFGRILIESLLRRDFPLVQGIVMVFATVYITMMLFLDIIYALINPKIRYG
jgi:peptide/nickel transport system permease protein